MSTPSPGASRALLNARYVALRTAEGKGLTARLLEASRDRTPGVRRLLAPVLYRFWFANRAEGWRLLDQIGRGAVRFPGLVDREALEIFGEVSMPILNACRHEPGELARLGAIWRAQMAAVVESPLARAAQLFARRWVLRAAANALGEVLKRQPSYQLVNYKELEVTFSRPAAFRAAWREALACLEQPELGPGAIERILSDASVPYDLYLMLVCERALIYLGARGDTTAIVDLLERLFRDGCPWFRQSIIYVLFHIFSDRAKVPESWLDRYDALARAFFASGSWRLQTSTGLYEFATILANPDVVAFRHRPDRTPRVIPSLLERSIARGDKAEIAGLFAAVDGVAFYHDNGPLALELIRCAYELGGEAVEPNVVASLATVRVQSQPLVDTFIAQQRLFAGISPDDLAAMEASVSEEDFLTLVDGFVIHLLLNSGQFRARLCGAFRRALDVVTVNEFFLQIFEWVRDELSSLPEPEP